MINSDSGGRPVKQLKIFPTIGVCGLDCGLCPRYYTAGPSRCPGCGGPDFSEKHPSCSFITCCVKKRGLEVCGQCPDFPCTKFKTEDEYRRLASSSSYPPYTNILSNLKCVKRKGIKAFVKLQKHRIDLLERMIAGYDEGRSRSFYCRAAAMLDLSSLNRSLAKAKESIEAGACGTSDIRAKAKLLRGILAAAASSEGIELKGTK